MDSNIVFWCPGRFKVLHKFSQMLGTKVSLKMTLMQVQTFEFWAMLIKNCQAAI
jgi:hypothetical protein